MTSLYDQLYSQIESLPRLKFEKLIYALLSTEDTNYLPKPSNLITKVEFLNYMKEIDRLNDLKEYLKNMRGVAINPAPTIFTNQVEAINQVMRDFSPPYRIIQGPAGYGKTRLLTRLRELLSGQGVPWECAYISISKQESTEELVLRLSEALGIVDLINRNPNLTPSKRLGNALLIKWNEIITKERTDDFPERKGLCLLIDLDKRPFETSLSSLFSEILPAIDDYLSSLEAFSSLRKGFMVIIGGRYLSKFSATWRNVSNLVAPIVTLEPFRCDVIRQATKQYLMNFSNSHIIDELAIYLSFYTGGHPECVFRTLELFKETGLPAPSSFFEDYNQIIWENIISKTINDIYQDMPQDPVWLPETFERLSVYRIIDDAVLNQVINKCNLSGKVKDAFTLGDILTTTYLINRDGRILRDDITRRLLVIGLWHKRPSDFPRFCRQARDIYERKTRDDIVPGVEPARWAIEFLFQCLQQYAPVILDDKQKQKIRKKFFAKEVPHILNLLIQNRNISAEGTPWEIHVINDLLDDDWEFRLYLNFCLGDSQFSDAPFQELRDHVIKFFNNLRGA